MPQGRRRDRQSAEDRLGLLLAGLGRDADGRGVPATTASACFPAPAYLEGEYGVRGFYVGVPVQIGAGGVEQVIEIALSEDEKRQFADR